MSRDGTVRLWDNAWEGFIRFPDHDAEIRKALCSINAMLNAFTITFADRWPAVETY